jgi:uncharacterized small protein (DUF1192 family)
MAIDPDESAPHKSKRETILGEDLSAMSAHELDARIAALEGEILRVRDELRARHATKNSAESFFKR